MAFAVTPSPATATASTTRSARVIEDPPCRAATTGSSLGQERPNGQEQIGMDDTDIHRLERAHIGQGLSEPEQARLADLGVQLDRYWDLLRQRDARRRAGLDPDGAQERPGNVVEGYRQ